MSFTATVENGAIKVPVDLSIPDGTTVEVTLPAASEHAGSEKWMLEFAGTIDGLPEDFAREHDHYIHGTPKRGQR